MPKFMQEIEASFSAGRKPEPEEGDVGRELELETGDTNYTSA
jgi:hypothetical protein